ncbi:MAG: hypothetical protein HS117_22225 [Verrucomicrobiaceae bacterium]|nr:hypothetical protein [Verrucomicrobiaceae bacterium]
MQFPLQLRFKVFALSPQIFVDDAAGQPVCYVKQKLFRFREKVELFRDSTRQQVVATIEADRIIDWSAKYAFKTPEGTPLGSVGRRGLRSLWRAHYEVFPPAGGSPAFSIHEENPMAKILDGIFGEIPLIGALAGYFIHPKYLASRPDGTPVMRLTKRPSFLERRFEIEQVGSADEGEQSAILMSFLMMILLERARG